VVAFTDEAIEDLETIRNQIALDYPQRANRIANEIVAKCKILDLHPLIGRLGMEPGTRELSTAKPWVIVYEVVGGSCTVLRLWHSSQSRR
jgi:addiction module RelE/StbE family toxin